jgi:hypothetical protein
MAYVPSAYGKLAYGTGLYSRGDPNELFLTTALAGRSGARAGASFISVLHASVLTGQSGIAARASAAFTAHGALTGQSSIVPDARLYWEPETPCDATWAPGVPCDADWAPATGCDVSWVVQPPPPLLCPEMADG